MLLPPHILEIAVTDMISVCILAAALWMLYRASKRYARRHLALMREGIIHWRLIAPEDQRSFTSVLWRDKKLMFPLAAGLALTMFSLGGRHMVKYAFPAG